MGIVQHIQRAPMVTAEALQVTFVPRLKLSFLLRRRSVFLPHDPRDVRSVPARFERCSAKQRVRGVGFPEVFSARHLTTWTNKFAAAAAALAR